MNEAPQVPVWVLLAVLAAAQALFGFMVMRLWKSVDDNTAATTEMRVSLPQKYITKEDATRHYDDDTRRFMDTTANMNFVRDRVHNLDLRITAIDGEVKVAQAGLRDR